MKKFNLFKEIITANTDELKKAIDSQKTFAINIYGEILTEPYSEGDILIYSGIPDKDVEIEKAFGPKYQIVVSDDRVLIKAFSNWQELIAINTPLASYDDTTADGVAEFSNKDLEEIGWNITEFNVTYRELVEVLEEKADGIILCIEQEEPYQFSGFGFLSNNEQAKDILFKYCQEIVKDKLANDDDFEKSNLEDDEEEAAIFFKAL
ncbi:MAG: hypothetical protein OQK48_07630 [Sulfurimonas sp.]|uniref:hypothetical protein n=1 Tax=Sulfurimonas sp. TaxID=2022749 RepID=UPI0026242BAE|nr:hypothetical protein [Sulfurimonas sp.]MCW8895951.1 hypothetical protein [Sulfurimonas sp.]MCW8954802.1 hypothetical protein [Sulfurimonas sp.]MCW9067250.1 hypothetical protein [Sulfurimonas sp.]